MSGGKAGYCTWPLHTAPPSSIQFSSWVMSLFVTPWTAACRLPCPSPTPRACSNSCPSSQWCHPTNPFSSCLQSFPASGSFPRSQFFASGGQSIGASASAAVLPLNIQDWFPLGWTGWISLQSRRAVQTLPKGWANHLSHSSGPAHGHTPFTPCKEQACLTSGSQQARDPVVFSCFPWLHQRPWQKPCLSFLSGL